MLAKKAVEKGLKVPPYVKTSLAPGSRVVTDYFDKADLDKYLDQVGFHTVGYGCTTCIGNSGPLPEPIANAVKKSDLVVGGRAVRQSQLRRPHQSACESELSGQPAAGGGVCAGRHDRHRLRERADRRRQEWRAGLSARHLADAAEVQAVVEKCVLPEMFGKQYDGIWDKNPKWNAIKTSEGELYDWDGDEHVHPGAAVLDRPAARAGADSADPRRAVLAAVGDSVTTDHISPAGSIAKDSPAGKFLMEDGVEPRDFNSYGARRGNDRVMTRGTFANIRIRNLLAPGTEGGVTRHLPDGTQMTIYDAAMKYKEEGVPLVVLAGAEYGTGSSRDWAAKGAFLLGVRAVIAASFERIHRSNLVGMGVLPLEFQAGVTWQSLGLTGEEIFAIPDLTTNFSRGKRSTSPPRAAAAHRRSSR